MPLPKKPPLTHFLCLPLVNPSSRPHLQASISRFTSELTSTEDATRIPLSSKAIRPVGALHFTLGVMSLVAPESLDAACSFLKALNMHDLFNQNEETAQVKPQVDDNIDRSDPLKITLSGLHPMQSPSKTSSLYISPVDPSPLLTPFCLNLQQAFRDAGFLLPDTRAFKLHATIVNTIYAREAKSGKRRWSKDSAKIDATKLLETYKDYEWVKDMKIDRVAICKMGAKKIFEGEQVVDQIYTEVASVPLP